MKKLLLILVLGIIISCEKEKPVYPAKDCLSYNLDKRVFSEDDTLVFNVCVHQLVPITMAYTDEQVKAILDSTTLALNKEKIYFRLKSNIAGTSYKDFGEKDTTEYNPIRRAGINNFEEYTFMDDPRCINVYLMPYKEDDFIGSAGDFIPDIHCAVQHWAFNTSTTPHELMHALGCFHVFEPDITDGYNDEYGDLVCDTPSAHSFGKFVTRFCDYVLPTKTKEESDVLVRNMMSNSPSYCRCTITQGQGKRIKKNTQVNKSLYVALYRK
jgi:hypothetical protein